MEKCDASTFRSSIDWSIWFRNCSIFAEIIDTYIPSNLLKLLHIFTQNWLHHKFPKSTQVRNWPSLPGCISTTSGQLLSRFWYILYYCLFYKLQFRYCILVIFWSFIEKVEKVEEKWENLRQKSSLLVKFHFHRSWWVLKMGWDNFITLISYIRSLIYSSLERNGQKLMKLFHFQVEKLSDFANLYLDNQRETIAQILIHFSFLFLLYGPILNQS